MKTFPEGTVLSSLLFFHYKQDSLTKEKYSCQREKFELILLVISRQARMNPFLASNMLTSYFHLPFIVLFFVLFSWSKIMGRCFLFFQRTESHSTIGNYLAPPCYFLDYKVLEHHIWNLKLKEIQNLIQPCKWHHLSQILLSFQGH